MAVFPICVGDNCWRHETSWNSKRQTFMRMRNIEYDDDLVMTWHTCYGLRYDATEVAYEAVTFEFCSRRVCRSRDPGRI